MRHVAEPIGSESEVIVIRGVLTDDLRFLPLACGSEYRRPQLKGCTKNDVELALLDKAGKPLVIEGAALSDVQICAPNLPRAVVLEGSIPLRPGAKSVAIYRRGIEAAQLAIGPKPQVAVEWTKRTVDRAGKYKLKVRYSPAQPGAVMKVFYVYGPDHYVLTSFGEPRTVLDVGFGDLPGGDACSIVVVYSSGLRTAVAHSKPFAVPPSPVEVEILRPRQGQVFAPWQPVELEARVRDREPGSAKVGACEWWVGKAHLGRGRLVYAGMFEPGSYTVTMRYGKQSRSTRFEVRKSSSGR